MAGVLLKWSNEGWRVAGNVPFGSLALLRTVGCFFTRNSGTVPMCGFGVVFAAVLEGPMESFFFLLEELFDTKTLTLALVSGLNIPWP